MERRISEAEMNVRSDILDMESTVFSKLGEADKPVQDWKDMPVLNFEKHCLDVEVSLRLRKWREPP